MKTNNGFTGLGKHIGVKKYKKDFGIIYSDVLCTVAGVFTKNHVKGAPVIITQQHIADGKAQAIVVNSGIANVCTGKKGIQDANQMAQLVATELSIKKEDVLVASTGIIGKPLPMDKISEGINGIKHELANSNDFAQAILTTDKAVKEYVFHGTNFSITACAKGSGMVHPNMATMLAFILTDAEIGQEQLQTHLKQSVDKSFNMINIDLDTSTSDMALVLANGKAGKPSHEEFQKALNKVCIELAKMIAADGEGATKLLIANANGNSGYEAKVLAKSIVNSTLVKCAVFGKDPNWGRILCALGNTGVDFDENQITVKINSIKVFENGSPSNFESEELSKSIEHNSTTVIDIDLDGNYNAQAFGCDLSYDYVRINSAYTT